MKKFILPVIILLTVAFSLPPKADAQTRQECDKTRARASYNCLTERTKCLYSCVDKTKDVKVCDGTCSQSNDVCEKQVEADYRVCLGVIKTDEKEVSSETELKQDCRKIFDKESYDCLKVSGDCQKKCSEETKRPDGGTYFNSGEIYSKCTKVSDCDGKGKACNENALANFRACQGAKSSQKASAKVDKSPLAKLMDIPVFIGDWLERISVGSAGLAFLDLSRDLGSVVLEDSEIAIWEEEQRQKYNKDFEAAFGKDWQYQMQFSQPKIEAKTEEEAWKIPVSNEESVIDVPGTSDTKRYSWGENSGVVVKSSDWEKIKFMEPVEVEGFTKHTLELGEGTVEVKVRNNKPAENQFGVDAGWLGVTVSRTHFWVSQSQDKKLAVVGVYEGEVEVKTKDGKVVKVKPDGNKPGVVVVSQKLSPFKLALAGLVFVVIAGGVILIIRKKVTSKGFSKKKK